MSAIKNVETVAQVGMVKLTGGVALYAAHIRQMDRENMKQKQQVRTTPTPRREHLERE